MQRFFRTTFLFLFLLITLSLTACQSNPQEIKKVKDLDFTVVEEADVPEALLELINQKKNEPFCLTYKNADAYYLCQGFGTQPNGGYSITVEELFLGEDSIYIKNTLLGPGKDELVAQTATHPYIVVKIERMDYPVVFQ